MPDLNQQFLADPQKFAKQWALYPATDPGGGYAPNGAHQKPLPLGGTWNPLVQMQGSNKVAYCEIRKPAGAMVIGDFMDDYGTDLNLFLMQITNLPVSATSFPVYFLPWAQDYTTRIKLKPSPHHPLLDGAGQIIDPNVFVTPAVQGCSVFIDGTEEEPVVYHINASTTGGAVFLAGTDALANQSAQAKFRDMQQRHQTARRRYPKDGGARGRHAPKRYSAEAHMTDYMGDFITPSGRTELAARHSSSIWNLWGLLGGGNTQTIQAGSIFGIRRHRKWKFYRQSRTRVTYENTVPGDAPFTFEKELESKWVATQCVQFWPVYRG